MTLVKSLQLFRNCLQIRQCLSFFSRNSSFLAVRSSNRKFVRVSGPDSIIYLQSLLTNDVRHLLPFENIEQKNTLYAYLLNYVGRILCDVFLYRGKVMSEGELLMEVDAELASALRRLLLGHSIKRKISVELANEVESWILIPKSEEAVGTLAEVVSDDLTLVEDPRLPQLGYRFISRLGAKTVEDISKFVDAPLEEGTLNHYQTHRYRLGVCEGSQDISSALHRPFECNGDYLNAVSISKGLYVSEEVLAKVYCGLSPLSFKGRKRIMPIEFLEDPQVITSKILPPRTKIKSTKVYNSVSRKYVDSDQTVGLLINSRGKYGLAMFNSKQIFRFDFNELVHSDSGVKLKTWQPNWWPEDKRMFLAQKESLLHHYFPHHYLN